MLIVKDQTKQAVSAEAKLNMKDNKFSGLQDGQAEAGLDNGNLKQDTGSIPSGGNINNNKNSTLPSLTHPIDSDPPSNRDAAFVTLSQALEDRFSARFDADLVIEFRRVIIQQKFGRNDPNLIKKYLSMWRRSMCLILKVDAAPVDWDWNRHNFYTAAIEEGMGFPYFSKLLMLINLFGEFHCRRNNVASYSWIRQPQRAEKQRFFDAKGDRSSNASRALTPQLLYGRRTYLKRPEFDFLYISLWLGLRPAEVVKLADPSTWKVEVIDEVKVLSIYQSKLAYLSKGERWKSIPLLESQQIQALKKIQAGTFKQPSLYRMKKVFGEGYHRYAGRKGFTPLMLGKEYGLQEVSHSLGHKNLKTTEDSYVTEETLRVARVRDVIRKRKQ